MSQQGIDNEVDGRIEMLLYSNNKVHPRRGYEGPQGEKVCCSTLSITWAQDDGVWSTPHAGLFMAPPPRKDPLPLVQEAGWDPGQVWTGAHTRIRSPDRPARTDSL